MRSHLITAGVFAALGIGSACGSDRVASPAVARVSARVVDQGSSASYDWHVGDAFLIALNPAFGPDVAEAPNGDRVIVSGTGTLGIHPKAASGGGTFTHRSSAGTVIGTGTWQVTDLLSFVSYGPSLTGAAPPSFTAGRALLRILIFPEGANAGISAILDVECHVPGSVVPGGIEEGINLRVPGIANFNEQAGGNTLFVLK